MSKAFTKDDTPAEKTAIVRRELVSSTENHMTIGGFQKLQAELAAKTEIDERYHILKNLIDTANVIVPEKQSGDRVLFGATVTVSDENESRRVYKIVGVNETDAQNGKVSWISPIGKALLQARVGDYVPLRTPRGDEELEILSIDYKPIA